jgi:CubicO group peptidase (beta-lactamase class C family)
MRMLTLFTLTISAALMLCSTAHAQKSTPTTSDSSQVIVPADWQALHDRWQTAAEELKIPGLAVVVVKGDQVVLLDAIGVCDPAGKQRVTPRSPFYLASVTKSFTALGVAILVEEGKVKLDEPVQTYLPRFTLADKEKAKTVTVRDLLCHRYGLDSQPISMAEAYLGNITDDRYYALLAAVRPRKEFSYSNLHYTLAGRIIEAVSGKPWQTFLAERVFAPLQMHDATCLASKLYANPLVAWPMATKNGKWELAPVVKNDAVMHAAGGMGASAADLGNWLRFQLTGKTPDGRQLISPELLREVHKRQVISTRPDSGPKDFVRDGYSLGWFTGAFHEHPMLEHGGGYIGTATVVSFLPQDQIGVAVLVNEAQAGVPLMIAADVYAKLLNLPEVDLLPWVRENRVKSQKRAESIVERVWQAPAAKQGLSLPVERYVGKFSSSTWGDAQVTACEEKLILRIGMLQLRWHTLGEDRFEIEVPGSGVVPGRFDPDNQGGVNGFTISSPLGKSDFSRVE